MAIKPGTISYRPEGDLIVGQWLAVTEADSGAGMSFAAFPDRTVQITGTFGGGTIALEGSNNGTDWAALHDFQGAAIIISDTSLKLIAENTDQIRPRATAGTGMSVVVTIIAVR